jgi:hypothetical protein
MMDKDLAPTASFFYHFSSKRYGYRADCRHDVLLTGLERRQTSHHIQERRTVLSTFETFSVNLLLRQMSLINACVCR